MKTVKVQEERLGKLWRFVYAKLYDGFGEVENKKEIFFQDENGDYDCVKIFWRFYWITQS